jgi:putative tricarboxylic transport membrane protein
MLGFGVGGYVLRKLEYDLAPFVIAFVLAPLLEQSLRQSLVMSPDGAMILIKRPVTAVLLAASAVLTYLMFRRRTKNEGGLS